MATQEEVRNALRLIVDPDLGKDIVSLGFVKNLRIEGTTVDFTLELTTPACPLRQQFKIEAETRVGQLPGVDKVNVTLTARKKAAPAGDSAALHDVEMIVAVSSCKGGVGKSTVAAHMARAMQRDGGAVGLLDLDIYGPSFPTLFKVHQPEVKMRGDMIQPVEVDGLKTMSLGYMIGDKPAVMRGPMAANYTSQILRQTDWGTLDILVIDLPPGTGDIQLTLVQQIALEGAVIVTTPQALSLVDVARGILMFEKVQVPVLGIVENMAWFECDNCGKNHFLFGNSTATLKERFGVSVLAQLPVLPGISDTASRGAGADIPAFATLVQNLHREIGKRRASAEQKPNATAEAGAVCIRWPDGNTSRIASKALRASCQCAACVDEFTGEVLLDAAQVPDDISVEELVPLGHYAISVAWSDGHSSSIYSWPYLKKIAESCGGDCAHCVMNRQ